MQMHYTANGKETTDKTRVGHRLLEGTAQDAAFNSFIANPSLIIPPGDPNHEGQSRGHSRRGRRIQALNPHMHVRGKAFQYTAIYASGEREILLKVPKYDFNWQINYILGEAQETPQGNQDRVHRVVRQLAE